MRNSISTRLATLERQPKPPQAETRTWRQVLRDDPVAWKQCMRQQKEGHTDAH